ncbi:MAG: 4-hydroxy-tetrahydrodipicolinate reductase [Pseudobdellovibrionaceae bacterium]
MRLKVGLLGFGRTGSVVAKEIVQDSSLSLEWACRRTIPENLAFASHALGFDREFAPFVSLNSFNAEFIKKNPVDIVIDFSSAAACEAYSEIAKRGIRIISAISNYGKHELETVSKAAKKTAVLYSPNITLGINWLMMASKVLKKIVPHADIEVVEEHFREKKEVSGTALRLAKHLDLNPTQHVNSIRVGGIVGKHEVIFGLPHQTIRLVHESINRAAFGTGAIFAAKWLIGQKPGLYSMEQVFQEKFINKIKELQF